jgi:hypothetical protein
MGDPPAGHQPFWQWEQWPDLLAEAVVWLAGARQQQGAALGTEACSKL